MAFPKIRMRRLRSSPAMRRLVRQTSLSVDDFVYPLFVREGQALREPIKSMADCFHFSPDTIAAEAADVASMGIPAVLLFGLPDKKDKTGSQAWAEAGVVQRSIKEIKQTTPDLLVITDVCLCEYTDHGHCGVIKDGKIDNDATCKLLAKMALSHAQAGADIVAPSDMMDGRVKYIREALEENDFKNVAIMSYAAKYASAFYGPFRNAAESAPSFGDRKGYQMDPANSDQAMAEIALDIEEGADIVMVKPALPYLDIIYRAKQRFDCPVAAYNVSGEYMMLNSAANTGLLDKDSAMLEMLYSIKRAGADIIITYFAKDAAKLLDKGQ
ncbi:MAG TPA: porphobilinogen synthase [Sedimentisphaerales bacterium]|nr:porphobilinogen synthase [Sedimentisphaerales bacterium]